MLMKASEVDEVLNGNDEKYKPMAISSGSDLSSGAAFKYKKLRGKMNYLSLKMVKFKG